MNSLILSICEWAQTGTHKIFPGGIDTGMWWVSSSSSSSDSSRGPSTLEMLEKMGREHDKKREEETMKRLGEMSRNGGW